MYAKETITTMANRIMLNETSYHGAGAIQEIATEAKAHGFQKAFVCSDPDLIKFGVTKKVTDVLLHPSCINPSPAHPQNLTANKKADGLCDQTIVEVISLSFSSSGKFPWENFIPIDRLLLFP